MYTIFLENNLLYLLTYYKIIPSYFVLLHNNLYFFSKIFLDLSKHQVLQKIKKENIAIFLKVTNDIYKLFIIK